VREFILKLFRFLGQLLYEARVRRITVERKAEAVKTDATVDAMSDEAVDEQLRTLRDLERRVRAASDS